MGAIESFNEAGRAFDNMKQIIDSLETDALFRSFSAGALLFLQFVLFSGSYILGCESFYRLCQLDTDDLDEDSLVDFEILVDKDGSLGKMSIKLSTILTARDFLNESHTEIMFEDNMSRKKNIRRLEEI